VDFSKAQFENLAADFNTGLNDFSLKMDDLSAAVDKAANRWFVTPPARKVIQLAGQKALDAAKEAWQFIKDLGEGILAPVMMFIHAWEWMDVRGAASGVSSSLSSHHLVVDDSDWSGKARDAYVNSAAGHSTAAAKISTIANSTSDTLLVCAAAGVAFYGLLVAVLVKLIAAIKVAIAAFASLVFSPVGVALILEEAGVNTVLIGGALTALATFVGAQAHGMVKLHGEAVDNSAFPGGKWPSPNTKTFNDATVTDGDADWSLAGG